MSCFQEDLDEGVEIVAHEPGPGLDRVAGRWEWILLRTVFFFFINFLQTIEHQGLN